MYAHSLASQLKSELGNGVHVLFGEPPQKQAFSQLLHFNGPIREFAVRRRLHKSAAVKNQLTMSMRDGVSNCLQYADSPLRVKQ